MKVLVNESSLEDIANAIRSKNGDTAKYKPSEMSSAINNITTTTVSPNYNIRFDNSNNETISLGWLRTDNMTSMQNMFYYCSSLTSLDLSKFSTGNVTNMDSMFNGCRLLTSLDLSSFNTSNVTNMRFMFGGCSSLTSLDLSKFSTSNVTNMNSMFYGCTALKNLDIRNFTFAQLTDGKPYNWDIFGNVQYSNGLMPADCKIIVKDDAVRNWIKSAKYATGWGDTDYKTYGDYFTNIKTVAELQKGEEDGMCQLQQ